MSRARSKRTGTCEMRISCESKSRACRASRRGRPEETDWTSCIWLLGCTSWTDEITPARTWLTIETGWETEWESNVDSL